MQAIINQSSIVSTTSVFFSESNHLNRIRWTDLKC